MKKFTILKNALLVAVLLVSGTALAQNLVKNPGFEEWKDGKPVSWSSYEGTICTQETTDVKEGTSAARISQEDKDAAKVGQYVNGLEEGQKYTISYQYKVLSTNKANTSLRAWLRWQHYEDGKGTWVNPINDAEKNLMQNDYAPDNLGEWSNFSITVTAPATTTSIHVDLRVYNGAVVLVDNVSVVKAGESSISKTESANRIYGSNGVVTVKAEKVGIAEVYNLLGQKITSFQVKEGDNTLNGLSKGQIYMVKFAGKTQKVVL